MGDLSAEPSMEDILSSIKRIIAEEGDPPGRARRPARPAPPAFVTAPPAGDEGDGDEILELSDPIPAPRPDPAPAAVAAPAAPPEPVAVRPEPSPAIAAPEPVMPPSSTADPIVSAPAAAASRGALDQLSRLMVKPEPASDGTLEGLVREMLRPMLSQWLDAHLPALVEEMVQREIKRITSAG